MRIIRGEQKGRRFSVPKTFHSRPTTDMAKEGLFSILENNYNFENIKVLDLFSGTGSISYEFASRGCLDITAVELNHKNADFIRKTSKEMNFEGCSFQVVQYDVFKYIKKADLNFDVIFADPPYELEGIDKLAELVFSNPTLSKEVWLIIEHSASTDYSVHPYFEKIRKYGKVNFSFFGFPKAE